MSLVSLTPMLFFKIDKSLWSSVKTFVVFLNKLPEYPHTYIHDIDIDEVCLKELRVSLMEKDKIDRFIDDSSLQCIKSLV